MGCCVLGALLMEALMRGWRGVCALVGVVPESAKRPNAALWRPGETR
jgi:hypothetical protein